MIGDAANFTSAGRTHWGWIFAIFILLLLLPAVFDTNTPTLLGIWALFALSLGLMWGYAGILSFGHAAYFGLGAYGAALLVLADMVARTVRAPIELPLGAVTALIGVPFFLARLRKMQ
jgi:ABC-type branched-subunit amino acid transport system permease subunit